MPPIVSLRLIKLMKKLRKKILFVMRKSPFQTSQARETFDILLMASSFEHEISLLFLHEGVLQLLRPQEVVALLNSKNFTSAYQALGLYDIKNVYISTQDLVDCGLASADLSILAAPLNDVEISALMQQQDIIFNV